MTRRRELLLAAAALPMVRAKAAAPARVVVVGGGYGGATAAKYLRLFSGGAIEVVLVEPEEAFVSCPMSNLVLAGRWQMGDITRSIGGLASRHGVRIVRDRARAVDVERRELRLARGEPIGYDKLILSPGIDMIWNEVEGLSAARDRVLQAWKAGPETAALRRQLEAMPDGGVFAITIPEAPYRCPPGPYERACLVADWMREAKPRAKLLILDANPDVTSKGLLFKKVWADQHAGRIEYRPQNKLVAIEGDTLKFELADDVRADVINALPPMRAGQIAVDAGLANSNGRWCQVRFQNFASTAAPHIHVIGDAIQIANAMPKSGHMANAQAKVTAAAITAELSGMEIDPAPMLMNTCYSFTDARNAVHVASVHAYAAAEATFKPVAGAGGLSAAPNEMEARYAFNWAKTIWADMLD
ncbi:FCSD flavin-binding domain-containing protein [Burkholderiaceae bacterium UC74_6]